ncbi:MAG: hypothetical protein HYZ50_18630 [Deltaproteobacteria bacterium]|nr:hypothetical protein [Deltaproteobacteria bacterium]
MKVRLLLIIFTILLLGATTPEGIHHEKLNQGDAAQHESHSRNLEPTTTQAVAPYPETKTTPRNEEVDEEKQINRAALEANEKTANETQRVADYTDTLATFTKALAGIGAAQAMLFVWQLFLIRRSTQSAETAARAAQQDAEATVLAQRAYLNASPCPPQPGMIEVKIQNYGETPASITAIAMQIDATLPSASVNLIPDKDFAGHYLVKTEWFFHEVGIPENLRGVSYFLFGYVEYMTAFDECRRLSFARQYDQEGKRFIFIAKGGWNHDCPCEGKD